MTEVYMSTAVTAFHNGEILAEMMGADADDLLAYRSTYVAVYDFGQHIDFETDDVFVLMALEDAAADLATPEVGAM